MSSFLEKVLMNYYSLSLIFVVGFSATAQADQVDLFAQGLADISGKFERDLLELIQNYENHRYVKNKKTKEERLQKDKELLARIKKSDSKKLLMLNDEREVVEEKRSILYRAINNELPFEMIEELIKKEPKLVDPNIYNKYESNDFYDVLKTQYFDLFSPINYSDNPTPIAFANYYADVIKLTKACSFDDQINFFSSQQIRFVMNFFNTFNKQIAFFDRHVKIWKKYDDLVDPAMVIFTSLINRSPESLRTSIVFFFNEYLRFVNKENSNDEEKGAVIVFLKYAVDEYKKLLGNETYKFMIDKGDSYESLRGKIKKLHNNNLEESYTLEEILKATGLEDVLKNGVI